MSDTDKLITIDRLRGLLAAYGARPDTWPLEERAAAQALIDASDEARALYKEEQALDALLQRIEEPDVSAALHSRVRSIAKTTPAQPDPGFLGRMMGWLGPRPQMAWQGAVVAAGILGIATGVGISPLVFDSGNPITARVVAVDSGTSEILTTDTGPATLASSNFSLTGEIATDVASDDTTADGGGDGNDGEFTVATIPLY